MSHRLGRRAMTLSEILIAAALVGVALVVLMLGMDGIRSELKRRQTLELLDTLDRSLAAYHKAVGAWPVDPGGAQVPTTLVDRLSSSALDECSGNRVIAMLVSVPASLALLQSIPQVLRVSLNDSGADAGEGIPSHASSSPTTSPSSGLVGIRDSWGRPLRCLTSASPSPIHRRAVAANENRPIFISAGPDGDFGSIEAAAASDNLRSDEPRR